MEKEEKIVEQVVEESTVVNEDITKKEDENPQEGEVVTSTEDETLAPTDDVIPAPVDDNTEIEPEDATLAPTDDVIPAPVDVPGTEITEPVAEPTTEEPVLDAPLADIVPPMQDIPVDAPVEVPGSEVVDPAVDIPSADPVVTAPEIPEEPAPVVVSEEPIASDVTPEVGDEIPCDSTPCDGTCCDDGCTCATCDNTVTVANYFGTLQDCVTIAWRFHLKTKVYRYHKVLNDFYEKALDIVDDIIEQYQGICGVVEDTFTNCVVGDGKSEGEYFTELKAFVENNKCVLGDHSELNSVVDEFLSLIDSTLYQLTSFTENAVKSFEEFVYEDYQAIKEAFQYHRCGDDPKDNDYDPESENGECGAEEEEEE